MHWFIGLERGKMPEKGNPVRVTWFGVFKTCSVVLEIRKSPFQPLRWSTQNWNPCPRPE